MAENKIKILFTDGSWFDFHKPANWNMSNFVNAMRSMGMVISDQFYCPGILVKAVIDMSAADDVTFGTSGPSPTAPSTETKQ